MFESRSDARNHRILNRRYAMRAGNNLIPALKGRAKVVPPLRVEDLITVSFSPWPQKGTDQSLCHLLPQFLNAASKKT
jgi:hypothetical protein